MAKKYYQTDEFKRLSAAWEKKLEENGLPDIEKTVGSVRALKQNASNVYRQMDPLRREAKEHYFRQLGSCVHTSQFDSSVDRIVMVLRAQGSKIKEICEALTKLGISRYRGVVRFIIRKYEDRWGIRSWSENQLNYNWRRPHTQ